MPSKQRKGKPKKNPLTQKSKQTGSKKTRGNRSNDAQAKLDAILKQQTTILKNESSLKKEEERIEKLEKEEITLEKQNTKTEHSDEQETTSELQRLEQLEQEVKAEVEPHPLTRITFKDFIKGTIGAFIGVVVHFTFTYGVELAENLSMQRASFLLGFSFLIGAAFLYGTGFRKIKDKSIAWLLPYRMIVLYTTSLLVTVGTLWFFYPHFFIEPALAYRQIATVNLSAVIGACTADLIGRGE